MIRTQRAVLCAMALACSGATLASDETAVKSAGTVKVVNGVVRIERGKERIDAALGAPIHVADRIRTGAESSVGVTLRDGTLLSAGPNSLLVIDQFAYDGTTHDGRVSVGVRKGTLSVASGKIAKKTPESVDFHTPTSVLGVRGTEFVIEVPDGNDD